MTASEVRCKHCRTLLGMEDDHGLTIQRGGMQATFPDAHTVMIVCYRCSKANLFTLAGKKAST